MAQSSPNQPGVGSVDPWTDSDPWGGTSSKSVKQASMSGPEHYDMAAGDSVGASTASAETKSGDKCIDCNQPAVADYHPRC